MRSLRLLLVALMLAAGCAPADAQMGFRGFGGGGRGFGGFSRGMPAGRGLGYGGRGFPAPPRGGFAPMRQAFGPPPGWNGFGGRDRGGRHPIGLGDRGPQRRIAIDLPRPRPPGRRPPIVHPRPPVLVVGPRRPRQPVIVAAPPVFSPSPAPPGGTSPQGSTPLSPGAPARLAAARSFGVPGPGEGRYVPDEVVLTTNADVPPARLAALEARLGLTPLGSSRIGLLDADVRRYRVADSASVRGTIRALQNEPDVRFAQPNYLFELQDEVAPKVASRTEDLVVKPPAIAEAARPAQYAIETMKLLDAHRIATGSNVVVAVIDTGLDETQPEIAGMVADRFDAVGGVYRAHAHGTAMAGVIVAHRDLVGIAPKAKLLAIRAFDDVARGSASGTTYDIVRGLDFAADHHARIVNMSFAGPRDTLLGEALATARSHGMIEIAAAGNAGPDSPPLYPAAEPGVIAITATDTHNEIFAMANRGPYIAAAAPGVDVVAPGIGGTVQLSTGTSIAAAEVSGVVALLLERRPGLGADEVRKILGGTPPRSPETAEHDMPAIDALAAVQAAN